MILNPQRTLFAILILLLLTSDGLSACSENASSTSSADTLSMAPMAGMPNEANLLLLQLREDGTHF